LSARPLVCRVMKKIMIIIWLMLYPTEPVNGWRSSVNCTLLRCGCIKYGYLICNYQGSELYALKITQICAYICVKEHHNMQYKLGKYVKICNLLKKIYAYNIRDGAFLKNVLTFDIILRIVVICPRTSSEVLWRPCSAHVTWIICMYKGLVIILK